MKKLILAVVVVLAFAVPALAVPVLQLDIAGGEYIWDEEQSTITGDTSFTLYALLTPNGKTTFDTWDQVYALSVSIYPESDSPFGSVSIDGTDYFFENYGLPPIDASATDLAGHGVFPTYYSEHSFSFLDSQTCGAYDVQYEDGPDFGDTGSYYIAFDIDTTNLAEGTTIHFDLYDVDDGKTFAPFSHDAGTRVPEPGSLLLLGAGLIGIAAFRRKLG